MGLRLSGQDFSRLGLRWLENVCTGFLGMDQVRTPVRGQIDNPPMFLTCCPFKVAQFDFFIEVSRQPMERQVQR